MDYPKFEGSDDIVETQISKSADILLQHAQSFGLDTKDTAISHYITNMANVMYDHDNERYIDGMRGVVALIEKAAEIIKDEKATLFEILNKGRELDGADKKTTDQGSAQRYSAIKLISFINKKTKAFKPCEANILIQELQAWINKKK